MTNPYTRGPDLEPERMGHNCSVCGGWVDVSASAGNTRTAIRMHNCATYLISRIIELELRLAVLIPRVEELELRLSQETKT